MGAPGTGVSEPLAERVEPVESEVLEFRPVSEEEVAYVTNPGADCLVVVNDDGVIGLDDNRK